MKRFIVAACLLLLVAAGARASQNGYVYVLDPATGCPTCVGPQVLVFDASTALLVTRIALSKGAIPAGIAVSRDGAHAYVSMSAGVNSSLVVIDARRHTVTTTYLTPHMAGLLAVRADDSAVFARSSTSLFRFDTATHVVTLTTIGNGGGIVYHAASDRVIVPSGQGTSAAVTAHDPVTLAETRRVSLPGVISIGLSRDESRLHAVGALPSTRLMRLDPVTLATIDDRPVTPFLSAERPAHSVTHGTIYFGTQGQIIEFVDATGAVTNIPLPTTTLATAIAVPSGERFIFASTARRDATGLTAVAAIDLDTRQIVSSYPLEDPPGFDLIATTPAGATSCTYRTSTAHASFTQTGQVRSTTPDRVAAVPLTTECAWEASSPDAWVHLSPASGSGNATVSISVDTNSTGQTRQSRVSIGGQLVTVTQGGAVSNEPFGSFDLPQDFITGAQGAMGITGWALDDVGVTAVHIYRDPVAGEPQTLIPLGDATFVEGARPDVAAIFSAYPYATRGGWGYMLLTNMLPGGGNGTFRVHAYLEDIEGHVTLLGSRTFTANNNTSVTPFGTIDTPGQGATVSGVITNFGWVLTPQPGSIPTDGSTISVLIDDVNMGHPVFGLDRADIAALFPGYANTHSAVGYLTIDTTTLTNGVHKIAWLVRDSLGRSQGIGSRYFTVANP